MKSLKSAAIASRRTGFAVPAPAAAVPILFGPICPPAANRRRLVLPLLALCAGAVLLTPTPSMRAANTADPVLSTATDLGDNTAGTTYTAAATTTSDVEFLAATTYTSPLGLSAALSIGTLDDFNATAISITGTGLLTLNTAANSVAPSAADLLYVASGANLSIQTTGGIAFAATGNVDNAGTLSLGTSPVTIATGTTLSFLGAGATTLGGSIAATNGAVAINNAGGSVTFSGANLYTGGTNILGGTLTSGADNSLPTAGAVTFGGATGTGTTGALNLSTFNQTIASLTSRSNSTTANTVNVASGKTLTINGAGGLSVGIDLAPSASTSKLTISGGGSLLVANTGANVTVGVAQTTASASNNVSTLDLTGLSSVTLGSSTTAINELRVGYGQQSNGTLLLSNTANTVTATTIQVGNSNNAANPATGTPTLTLGTGTNVLNADTINIAASTTNTTKSNGTITFASQTPGSAGSVTIANKAGTGAAAINIGVRPSSNTGSAPVGALNLFGHSATVNAGIVTIGSEFNAGGVGSNTGTLSFDTDVFTAATVNVGINQSINAASSGAGTGTLNIGQSAASTGTFTVGTLNVAAKSGSGTGAAVGTINVAGGSLTVNTAFTLGSQTGTATTTGTTRGALNITGGTVTSNVDILKGAGTSTDAVTLNGGTLDLKGHNLGSAVLIDNLNFQSGTLQNVAQINNGAGLAKSTVGTLTLAGTNTYTGPTSVGAGTLLINGSTGAGSAVNVQSGGTLGGTGTAFGPVTVSGTGTVNPGPVGTAGTTGAVGMLSVGSLALSATTSTLTFDLSGTAAYDRLVSSGLVTLGGSTLNISLGGGSFANGDVLNLITGSSLTGTFAGLPEGALAASNGTYNFIADYTTTGFNLDVMAVPEPSTWTALVLGILAGAVFKLRRKVRGA